MNAVIAYVRKLIVYVVGVAGGSASAGSLPFPYNWIVPAVVGITLGVVHYAVPNGPKPTGTAPQTLAQGQL